MVPRIWGTVAAMLEPAVQRLAGRYLLDDVLQELRQQKTSLWVAFDDESQEVIGAVVFRVAEYPRRRLGRIEYVAGTQMKKWGVAMLDVLERYARDYECSGIESGGRLGWQRLGKAHGFRPTSVSIEKDF